jgi:hypothetical protein
MKSTRHALADWKIILILWLPLFAALLWYAIAQHFDDLWLAAIALALAAWGVCSWGVFTVRKWQQWRASVRRE